MTELLKQIITVAIFIIEISGIFIITGGAVYAVMRTIRQIINKKKQQSYTDLRQDLGKSILLGLEFLVAGDIIRTVVIEPNVRSVGVLAVIVFIRTLLSFSLDIETNGKLPWRK
jgi:uncharacterized membrane protein